MRIDHVINHREHCFKKLKYFYLIEQVIVSLVLLYWVYYDKLLKGKIGSSHLIPPQGNATVTTPRILSLSQPSQPHRSSGLNELHFITSFNCYFLLSSLFHVMIKTFNISPFMGKFSEFKKSYQELFRYKNMFVLLLVTIIKNFVKLLCVQYLKIILENFKPKTFLKYLFLILTFSISFPKRSDWVYSQ